LLGNPGHSDIQGLQGDPLLRAIEGVQALADFRTVVDQRLHPSDGLPNGVQLHLQRSLLRVQWLAPRGNLLSMPFQL
jgi:hypothetical protein